MVKVKQNMENTRLSGRGRGCRGPTNEAGESRGGEKESEAVEAGGAAGDTDFKAI